MKFFQKKTCLPLVMASTIALSACAHEAERANSVNNAVVVEHAVSAQIMQLSLGETFTARLASNPSTGYSWTLIENVGDALKQGERVFESEKNNANMAGVGGVDVWKFEAVKKGQQTLRFEYRRPWEKDIAATHVAVYNITVK